MRSAQPVLIAKLEAEMRNPNLCQHLTEVIPVRLDCMGSEQFVVAGDAENISSRRA